MLRDNVAGFCLSESRCGGSRILFIESAGQIETGRRCVVYDVVAWLAGPQTLLPGMSVQVEGHPTPQIPYFSSLSRTIYSRKIALLGSSSTPAMAKSQALQSNLDVDYVISYRFAGKGRRHVIHSLERSDH